MTCIFDILNVYSYPYLKGYYRGRSSNLYLCWIYIRFYIEKWQETFTVSLGMVFSWLKYKGLIFHYTSLYCSVVPLWMSSQWHLILTSSKDFLFYLIWKFTPYLMMLHFHKKINWQRLIVIVLWYKIMLFTHIVLPYSKGM